MNQINNGWFSDINEKLWPGQAVSVKVEQELFHGKSKYQDIQVLQTSSYGKVMALDGAIQVTEKDECAYQEMISFLPLNSHPNPERVLIIGGGDGGVVREVVKHPAVKQVTLCEIDEMVMEVSKKYLPSMSVGFKSSILTVHTGDGFEFLKNHSNYFDVIITDSSDPEIAEDEEAPAATLFSRSYFTLVHQALKKDGIACSYNGGSIWFDLEEICKLVREYRTIFPVVDICDVMIPSFCGGASIFMLMSKNPSTEFKEPLADWDDEALDKMRLNYYSPEMHKYAFVFPTFAKRFLKSNLSD